MNSNQFLDWLGQKAQSLAQNTLDKPLIMGVVNVTTDSFSDGGLCVSVNKAYDHALALVDQGADIIDIGGESTRPGALQVPVEVEMARVIPVIEAIRRNSDVCISIDTYKPAVMEAAVKAGANLINDINALRSEGALEVAASLDVPVCLMHMQGNPRTMQENPSYPDGVVAEIKQFFEERIKACIGAGIREKNLLLDPGFGFGKTVRNNLDIVKYLRAFKAFKLPILLGVSRKSTIGTVLDKGVEQRLIGGITLALYAALQGVGMLRTHDVEETKQALHMLNALLNE